MEKIIINNKKDLLEMAFFLKKLDFCKSTNEAVILLKQGAVSVYNKNKQWFKFEVNMEVK